MMRKYAVTDVNSVSEFLEKYYKPERYQGRGEEYARKLLTSKMLELMDHDYAVISHHDSVTGKTVSFYRGTRGYK